MVPMMEMRVRKSSAPRLPRKSSPREPHHNCETPVGGPAHDLRQFVATLPDQVSREKRNQESVGIVGIVVPLANQGHQNVCIRIQPDDRRQPAASHAIRNCRTCSQIASDLRPASFTLGSHVFGRDCHSAFRRIRGFERHFNHLLRLVDVSRCQKRIAFRVPSALPVVASQP